MTKRMLKKLILCIFSICILLGSLAFCFAEESIKTKLELKIPPTSKTQDTHVANTPQYGDELQAVVTYDKTKITEEPVITWYRFNNHPKYDEHNNKIADYYYDEIHTGSSYTVTAEDIQHKIKIEAVINGETLVLETNPVGKKNYGEIKLKVVDNTNYGDTDGYIGYLDNRMQYTNDNINIFDVESDGTVLLSGSSAENLNPNGYCWQVRYRGTDLVEQSDWYVFTIKPGRKIPIEDADINLVSRTLTPDESEYQLKTIITPDNAYVGSISYTSSDAEVATVSQDGLIKAVNNGTATITVTVNGADSVFTKECEITVKKFDVISSADIKEDNVTLKLQEKESTQLTSAVAPETADEYTTSWRSSDESVCTVDSKGLVTAVSDGNAVITFSAVQGDISVMDTVNVKVLPVPSVTSVDEWFRGCNKDLAFEFEGCTPDENTIVSITCENGRSEIIYSGNYRIEGNRIIISYDYLMYMPSGNASFSFEFSDEEESEPQSNADNDSIVAPQITSAAYTDDSITFVSKAAKVISSKMIKLISDDDSNDDNSSNETPSKKILVKTVLLTSSEEVKLRPGKTVYSYSVEETGSLSLDVESGADSYFEIQNRLSESNPGFTILSKGLNSDKSYTIKLMNGSAKIGEWSVSALDFIDFTGVSLTLDSTAAINPDSASTCIITPAFSNGIKIDTEFLNGYDISFMEVSSIDKDHQYSGPQYYFKQDSLKLNTSDFKLHAVANRNGTGYIRAILSLKMTDGSGSAVTLKEIKKSANSTSVSISLYKDVTSVNKQHLWSQNSTVNLVYTIQGDFSHFLNEYGGEFSDNNVRLWYKRGTIYNPLTIGGGQFSVELINESLINVTISYSVLRRLYLGSYPLYISFKYDGSDFSLGPWNGNPWSKNGNYVLSVFSVIKSGTPITGDTFSPVIWIGITVITASASAVLIYALRKKKKKC